MANQTPATPKAFILSFPFRRTGMGGFDDTILMSFRSKKPIKSVLRTSRTGNHGDRSYRLFPAKYVMYEVSRSNAGNLYCTISIITLKEDGEIEREKEWQVCNRNPVLTLDDLPENIRTLLVENKDELPLFDYIFPFDHQNNQQDNNQEGE
jgi:hypothetical protein